MKRILSLLICTGLYTLTLLSGASAQTAVPLNTIVSEHFNTIGSSGTATLPANWKFSSAGTGAGSGWLTGTNTSTTTQAASSGSPVNGGAYNWATTAGTDRAIGFMGSGSYASPNSIMAYYRNTTGATLTTITVAYSVERYRVNSSAFQLNFYSSTDGSTWTARTNGDISAAGFPTGASSYSFNTPRTLTRTVTITGLSIANNADFYLRWLFTDASAATAQGIALDNVSLYAGTATPIIRAKLRDQLTLDNIPLNQANSGDQLTYTTVISNTGSGDATNVTLTAPAPVNTTLSGGSIVSSALARDDSYSTPFNTVLSSSNVLTNDYGLPSVAVVSFGPSASPSATAAGGTGSSDNGGTVLLNADGSFTYTPASGFAGIDKFAYIAGTGTAPDNSAVVTITVGSAASSVNDAYTVTGNVYISHAAGSGLLSNDAGTSITVTAVNGNAANVGAAISTAQGGSLTVQADGSFTYNPPAGYEGSDNFTYTIDNGFGISSTATVSLTISGMIWFINNSAGTAGDGRLSSPFNTLAAFNSINNGTGNNPAAGDHIFLYTGAGNYTGGTSLLNNQRLIGQGASVSIAVATGISLAPGSATLPATGGTNPVIINAAGNGITTAQGNIIRGVNLGNCSGNALHGNSFSTLTISEASINTTGQAISLTSGTLSANFVSVSSSGGVNGILLSAIAGTCTISGGTISGNSGACISIPGGSLSASYAGSITQSNNAPLVSVTMGHTIGTISFSTGTLSATNGTGLQFDNADGIYNFTGTVTLNGGDAGIDIINGSSGNFTFSSAAITNPSGTAITINGGNGVITHSGTISKTSAGRLVDIQSRTGGSVTLNGNLSSTASATGINVSSNTGGTISFAGTTKTVNSGTNPAVNLATNTGATINFTGGGLGITTTSGAGFSATGGGTVSVQGTGNTLVSTTGTALTVTSTAIGAAGITFQSISSNGSSSGIVLNGTGSAGGLTVTGTGVANSGGTIQNCTSNGVSLTSASSISLSYMTISGNLDDGINGSSVTHFSLANCSILNNGNSVTDEGIQHTNLAGNCSISNTTVTGSAHNNLYISNNSGTLSSFTVSGSSFSSNNATTGNHGVLMEMLGTAVLSSSSFTSSSFASNRSIGMQVIGGDAAVITLVTVSGCTFSSNQIGIDFSGSNGPAMNLNFNSNTLTGQNSHAINVFLGTPSTNTLQVKIDGNTIGNAAVAGSGSAIGNGIRINGNGNGTIVALLNNNVIRQTPNGRGIEIIGRNGTGRTDVTVTNNNVNPQDVSGFPLSAIIVQSNTVTVTGYTVRADIRGNTVPAGTAFDLSTGFIALVETSTSNLQLVNTTASGTPVAQLTATNTGSTSANAGVSLIAGPINVPPF